MDEIEKDWKKLTASSKKTGYIEGVSDGRESTSQKYFDEGYTEGFRNGFKLGQKKGTLSVSLGELSEDFQLNEYLENSRLGACQICKNEDLLTKPKEEVMKIQSLFINNILRNLDTAVTSNTSKE